MEEEEEVGEALRAHDLCGARDRAAGAARFSSARRVWCGDSGGETMATRREEVGEWNVEMRGTRGREGWRAVVEEAVFFEVVNGEVVEC